MTIIKLFSSQCELQRESAFRQRTGHLPEPDLDRDGVDSVPDHPRRRVRRPGRALRLRSAKVQADLRRWAVGRPALPVSFW